MPDLGDALLYTLSAKGKMSWRAFKAAFDALLSHENLSRGGSPEISATRARAGALASLDELGHCEVNWNTGDAEISVAPPFLALLPSPGLPRAVLCGARSPQTLEDIRNRLCETSARGLVHIESQEAPSICPARIEIEAGSFDELREVASSLAIGFAVVPPAWQLAELSGSLDEYLRSLEWTDEPEINWEREDFDPEAVRFGGRNTAPEKLRLSRYTDPVRGTFRYALWRRSSTAKVNPDWGRFAVLADGGVQVLEYDKRLFTLILPLHLPLPKLLARALALCSGRPPMIMRGNHPPRSTLPRRRYRSVPPDVVSAVAAKLGQAQLSTEPGRR